MESGESLPKAKGHPDDLMIYQSDSVEGHLLKHKPFVCIPDETVSELKQIINIVMS